VWTLLAIRNYASQPSYKSLQNRQQGDFNTIITLGTPELGTELARFLVEHRTCTRTAPIYSNPVWVSVCTDSPTKTVAQCFADMNKPLSAPDQPIETGAVYSLIPPGNKNSLANPKLSEPNIAGANWLAVGAVAPSNSSLEYGLNSLFVAIYSPFAIPTSTCMGPLYPAQTINQILGTPKNDAIVTLSSQLLKAKLGHSHTFQNLSHTHLFSFAGFSDANVLQSPDVNQLVACWLSSPGDSGCFKALPATAPASGNVASTSHYVDRLAVEAPVNSVELGFPFDLPVDIGSNGIPELQVVGRGEKSGPAPLPATISGIDGRNVHLNVTPLFYGEARFQVVATYPDGGISFKEFTGTVNLPFELPSEFHASLPISEINLNYDNPSTRLAPWAIYASIPGLYDSVAGLDAKVPRRIYLDARYVSYSIAPAADPPSLVSIRLTALSMVCGLEQLQL
jgi:hypothetical protein